MYNDTTWISREGPALYVAFLLFLLTPFLAPGFFPFDVNTILACSAALIFACLLAYRNPAVYVSRKLVLAFVIIALIQLLMLMFGSISAPGSWQLRAVEYLSLLVMLTAGVTISAASIRIWMKLFMAMALAWSLIGLYVWCGGTGGHPLMIGPIALTRPPSVKLAGPFNQGNIFASMIGMAWIFAHWLFLRERRLVHAFAILFFTAMMFDTLSRGGWIAYSAALLLMFYAIAPTGKVIATRLLPGWLAGLALGVGLHAVHVQAQIHAESLLFAIAKTVDATLEARLVIWATAIVEFLHAPFTGVGWGQFPDAYWHSYAPAQEWMIKHFGIPGYNSFFWSAHNLWLHVLAEGGLAAFVLLLWGTWNIIAKSLALVGNGHSVRLPFAMVSLGFLCQSLVNISFTRPLPMLVWGFFTGIAFAPWLRKDGWRFRRSDVRRYASVGIAIVVISWASRATSQWYTAASWLKKGVDLENMNYLEEIVPIANTRAGAIPLILLAYNVSKENKHLALLTWMLPYLRRDTYEIPYPDTYQVYFLALVASGKQAEACKIGKLIEKQGYSGETNGAIYRNVCAGKPMAQAYHFGH